LQRIISQTDTGKSRKHFFKYKGLMKDMLQVVWL